MAHGFDTDQLVIFQVPYHDDNDDAQESLRSLGEPFETIIVPPTMIDLYHMPFIEDSTGSRHFGLDGIRRFVQARSIIPCDPMAGAMRRTDDNLRGTFT